MLVFAWENLIYEEGNLAGQREVIIVKKIQEGDELLREQFICDYKPFILKCVSKFCQRFIEIENDEEYSIGMIAFNEAINGYSAHKGCSFIGFADQVIRRRLIDFMRKNKNDNVHAFTNFEEDKEGHLVRMIDNTYMQKEFDKIEISEEIISLSTELSKFSITFNELVSCAPKHWDSRLMCIGVARQIVSNPDIYERLKKTRNIPVNELLKIIDISKRTVGKNRKYIIALCLVMNSELDIIKNYIFETEKGGRIDG